MRMFKLGNQTGFPLEAGLKIGVFTESRMKGFQSYITIKAA